MQDCIFADAHLNADTELTGVQGALLSGPVPALLALRGGRSLAHSPTLCALPAVLAALAYWAEKNAASESTEHKRQVAAICGRIRFPDIPASALLMYHARFKFLQLHDPNRDLLLRAVSGWSS